MSSSPRSDLARRWRPARWSLRTRLLVALVAVVAGVCAVIGVATTVAVYQFQFGLLVHQLTAAVGRTHDAGPPGDEGGRPRAQQPPQDLGTIATIVLPGDVHTQQVVDPATGSWRTLSSAQVAVLFSLPADGQPHTRDVPGLGPYRLMVGQARDGDRLFTGLPMGEVYATRNWLIALEIAIGLAAALLAGLIGATVVGRNLRPLRRVAATASRVAELPLDRGEVALSVRVPEVDTDPRTEVGQVGAALNRMLGHVANALAVRQASETRVRRADPAGLHGGTAGRRPRDAAGRVGDRADDRARRGHAAAGPARLGPAARRGAGRPVPPRHRRGERRARRRPGPPLAPGSARGVGDRH